MFHPEDRKAVAYQVEAMPLQDTRSDTVRNPRGGFMHGLSCQMGITARRLDLTVTEELPDHRQTLPERQRP